nr:hypothetical protein [Tanacetum cinerariifolium]
KMADVTAPSGQASAMAPPVRTDDQILPRIRALTTIINLCLTGKTSGFERPRAPVLKIIWGIVKRANIDYAERILEEFTQSIHTFIEDKQNLSRHTTGKKKTTLIVIPSIRSVQGTKREVFKIAIPGSLIITNIQEASYYQEYLENVAKHRRYMAGEIGSDQDSPTPKPTKPARKPKSTTPKAPPRPSVFTLAEDVPAMEPPVAADLQKALEESMKTAYALPRGPLPPVVIRELESGKYRPLPDVPGKGKAKVTEELVAHDLLSLQKPKKKISVDQYIFQRRTFTTTGSSRHDEPSYAELKQSEREESEKGVPGADEGSQGEDEGQARPDPGAQAEGQTGSDAGTQDEGQAGSNPNETFEGHARPDPEQLDEGFTAMAYLKVQENLKLAIEEQVLLDNPASSSGTLSSLQHLSKDTSFGDLFFSDKPSEADNDKTTTETEVKSMVSVTIQQDMSSIPPMTSPIISLRDPSLLRGVTPSNLCPKQIILCLKISGLFKATTTNTTTTKTTTTQQPPPGQQQSTAEAMMMKRIGKLEHIIANLIQVNKYMVERLDKHGARLSTLEQLDIPQQETESYKSHEDHMQLFEALENSMNRDHSEELAQDLAEARKKKKKSRESPKTPPGSPPYQPLPPPLPAGPSKASGAPGASGSSQVPPPPPPPSSTNQESPPSISLAPADLEMDEDMGLDEQAQLLDDEDIKSAYIHKVNLRQDYGNLWKKNDLLRQNLLGRFHHLMRPSQRITGHQLWHLTIHLLLKTHFLHRPQIEECHKLLTDSVDDPILRHNVSKPLPLGGPPGQVIIQFDFFFNKDLEYLRYGSKGSRPALSISKMKAAYYPNAGLDQMDKYGVQMLMRFNEIHKFSNGTLQQIDKALGYRVKEFRINRMNPGLNTRFWKKKDVHRSKAFMFTIQRCLKTMRIFRNLESFVGGRVERETIDF